MSWNYRVVKTIVCGEESYGIHEVYYDEQGEPRMFSADPCPVYSETLEGLEKEISRFEAALGRPILQESNFPGAPDETR